MQILILAPLFPPDVGGAAEYVKELAQRLSSHTVTVLIYGHLPESIANVHIVTVDKRASLPIRLLRYTVALYNHSKNTDLVIINNGPSTELPVLLIAIFRPLQLCLCESDSVAAKASLIGGYGILHRSIIQRAKIILSFPTDELYRRQEILPFGSSNEESEEEREAWWQMHLEKITVV